MPSTSWLSYGRTHIGKIRSINQDAFANIPEKSLWVVADGMGGHKDGDFASRAIVKAMQDLEPTKYIGATVKRIYQQLHHVNQHLLDHAAVHGENDVIGSTVAILLAHRHHCVTMWSGDSRIYLFRRGILKQITRDHNNESKLLADGYSMEEIKQNPYAQTLTHAIGGESEVFLDAQALEACHDDIFLLCSDGLTKEVADSEIEDILGQAPYRQAVDLLMDLALLRGGRDNITVLVVKCCRQTA
ncbi:PP2C family protein-serine/threonine phosphatase [Methylomarinum vadi]|uniref:PP2C family protein-serine/threonine phosphatase n=1 Tax=Methylomarinum vadi TaxID=438855 RepID=UPI0004DF3D09|nr:protein phosphatase 2C domain-containing protein [Methylomarinum vadi]